MRLAVDRRCLAHDTGPGHPESPDRLRRLFDVADDPGVAPADRTALARVHDPDYLDRLAEYCREGGGRWDADTVCSADSDRAARVGAGLALWAVGRGPGGGDGPGAGDTTSPDGVRFALGRPPGHHAVADDAMGFCLLNNAAVAAEAVLAGEADRVAVLDWDLHHGNGTQAAFRDRPEVLYVSLHQRGLFPGTGAASETGTGPGAGTTLNLPLPAGTGDRGYLAATERAALPAVERHDPDWLVVSAGFDAHRRDPLGRQRVSTAGFGLLADRVARAADRVGARLAFVLEGGYDVDALRESVLAVRDAVEGEVLGEPETGTDDGVEEVVRAARERLDLAE
jgi:acetoin utilization deacetylase AcuC-like enzyme